jgi:hypothetical protein
MTGLSWLLLTLGGIAHATEFQLDTDTPDALCPELSMTREAVRRRLGQLETEAGGGWRGSYSIVHDPSGRRGDHVYLVIRDAGGKEYLTRELPLKGESCDTLAQAIALVVDGFFRELSQSPGHDEADANPPPSERPRGAASANGHALLGPPLGFGETEPRRLAAERRPRSTEARLQAGLALGGGYESVPNKPTFALGLFLVQKTWRLQLQAGLPLSSQRENHGGGAALAYVAPLRLDASYVLDAFPRVQWFIGPQTLLSLEHGSSQDVLNGHSGWRVSAGIGAQTGVAYWVSPSVALAGSFSVDEIYSESRKFLMYEQPVLELSRTRLAGTLGLWAVISP